jgi:hypothetical protein
MENFSPLMLATSEREGLFILLWYCGQSMGQVVDTLRQYFVLANMLVINYQSTLKDRFYT